MAKRTITITIPDDVTTDNVFKLFYALCAQCEGDEESEPWSPSDARVTCDIDFNPPTNDNSNYMSFAEYLQSKED